MNARTRPLHDRREVKPPPGRGTVGRMADERDWLEVNLDMASRRGLAERVERHTSGSGTPELRQHLLRMLRGKRDELLLDAGQAQVVLEVLNIDKGLSALRARLEAFLRERAGVES
jgi:hypothetical protein